MAPTLALITLGVGPAASAPMPVTTSPNLYEFAQPDGGAIYAIDPLTGLPTRLAYRDAVRVFEAAAEDIRVEDNELGTLVTATYVQVPEHYWTTISLQLPRVNLERTNAMAPVDNGTAPEMLTAYAILASHRTSGDGPDALPGQIDNYAVRNLIGKASYGTPQAPAQTSTGVIGRILMAPTCGTPPPHPQPCIAPFAGARVWLSHPTLDVVFETTADARGLFAIEAPGGSYSLHAAGPDPLPECPVLQITIPEVQIEIWPWPETRQYAQMVCFTGVP